MSQSSSISLETVEFKIATEDIEKIEDFFRAEQLSKHCILILKDESQDEDLIENTELIIRITKVMRESSIQIRVIKYIRLISSLSFNLFCINFSSDIHEREIDIHIQNINIEDLSAALFNTKELIKHIRNIELHMPFCSKFFWTLSKLQDHLSQATNLEKLSILYERPLDETISLDDENILNELKQRGVAIEKTFVQPKFGRDRDEIILHGLLV